MHLTQVQKKKKKMEIHIICHKRKKSRKTEFYNIMEHLSRVAILQAARTAGYRLLTVLSVLSTRSIVECQLSIYSLANN